MRKRSSMPVKHTLQRSTASKKITGRLNSNNQIHIEKTAPFPSNSLQKRLTRISHRNRHEMSEMAAYSRRATEGIFYVLSVHSRCPTEHNAEDAGISDIAVDSCEKCGLVMSIFGRYY